MGKIFANLPHSCTPYIMNNHFGSTHFSFLHSKNYY